MAYFSGAMVAKKPIKLSNCVWKVGIAFAVNNVNPFGSMRVVKTETVFLCSWGYRKCETSAKDCNRQQR